MKCFLKLCFSPGHFELSRTKNRTPPENVNANLIDSIRGGENDFRRQKYGNFLIGFHER